MLRGCRHQRGEAQLREALGLYETLQAMTEDIHGTRDTNNALALRSIADVHSLLAQHGAPPEGPQACIHRERSRAVLEKAFCGTFACKCGKFLAVFGVQPRRQR